MSCKAIAIWTLDTFPETWALSLSTADQTLLSCFPEGLLFTGISMWLGLGSLAKKGNLEKAWWLHRMLVLWQEGKVCVNGFSHVRSGIISN